MAHAVPSDATKHEVRIEAAPEVVFSFFTDPHKMSRWKGTSADLDPRPGGLYRVGVTTRDVVVGGFVELDPPTRIVFTWGWEASEQIPPGSSTVEVTLIPDGDVTILRLVHRGLPDGAGPMHEDGWDHFLPRLSVAASGGDPGRRLKERQSEFCSHFRELNAT